MSAILSDELRDLSYLEARAAPDLADWLVSLEVANKADRTISSYRVGGARLLTQNMELAIEDFRAEHLNAWLASYPRKSRHIMHSIGNQFFTWLVWQERLVKNPMDKVPRVKAPPRPLVDCYSEAERSALMGLPRPHGWLFALLFGSGIRRNEAVTLKWLGVDFDRARIHVVGKGSKMRAIPLLDFALIAVADLHALERPRDDYFVFCKTRGPGYRARWREKHRPTEELSTTAFQRWYADCVEAAGVTYRKPHTTRHTYNEILREEDYDLEERQLLLGHASSRTTADIYGHLSIEDVARKMRAGA